MTPGAAGCASCRTAPSSGAGSADTPSTPTWCPRRGAPASVCEAPRASASARSPDPVTPGLAAVLAVSQRPLAARAFTEAATVAAWRTKPSWGLVASADRTINPEVERYGYERAGMVTVEVDSSHLVMLSRPRAVVELIQDAVQATAH
ncbi:alpha/beta fold hydrolase [Streptomyces wedmorensis]|uniref:Alpha/beta fold hydrolase n=1 Tax=Streptomyces wedmorensis TaxID=43759 RepID=A0ABW6ISI8_STRWE